MSKYSIEESTLTSITDKVRTLRKTTGLIVPENLASQIQAEADLGKVKLEECKITLMETTGYGLAATGLNIWHSDPDGKLRHMHMGAIFQIDGVSMPSPSNPYSFYVAKNSILFIQNSAILCPLSDLSGSFEGLILKNPNYIVVIDGDTTFKFDYD